MAAMVNPEYQDTGPRFRHEYKFQINTWDYYEIRARLRVLTKPDCHAKDGEYVIRSLYFDNADDKALREKVNGVNHREKFRIRYYNDDLSFLRLEKKSKVNGLCHKVSAPLTAEECRHIIDGDYSFLRKKADPLLLEFYAKLTFQQLRPRAVIIYDREPYVHPAGNVRVTFDRHLRTGLSPSTFLAAGAPVASRGSGIILEVKYDEFLPEMIKDAVGAGSRQAAAFSKYAYGRLC